LLSEDEAHSLLDATRAMQKLLRDGFDRVAFVGHSQGGHAVLSAQALARSYGMAGQLVGVAAMAPFWAPGRTFGAIIAPELMFNTHDNPGELRGELSFAVEYFYTHAELYDGRGRGAALFTRSAQAALPGFVSSCSFENDPSVLGTLPSDIFQASLINAVGPCGVSGGSACTSGLAATWERRFRADRPKLDAAGAPVVLWQGANDLVINPLLAKCGIDKISADLPPSSRTAKFTQCGDPVAAHEDLLSNQMGWVTRWIDARALGTAEPAACQTLESITGPLMCLTPPGNQD
jgi:pimeloyl-ACP methyl ester carboxylesterase